MDEHTNEEATFQIVPKSSEIDHAVSKVEIVDAPTEAEINLAENIPRMIAFMEQQKAEYLHRISVLEQFLGFARGHEDLAVRMARLEKFVGIGG